MKTQSTSHSAVRYLVQHYVELLTVLTLLFVLQTGLVPFDFGSDRQSGNTGFFSANVTRFTFPDVVSNIFLYFPLGVLIHWSLCRAAAGGRLILSATVVIAVGISGAVEWVQAYSPTRVSSLIDLVCNSLGAALGASVSSIARWIVPQLMGKALAEFHERLLPAVLKSYCVLLVVIAVIPFSFSLDRTRLKHSVQSVNLVPFAAQPAGPEFGFSPEHIVRGEQIRWQQMKRWSRWSAECASFGLLALLLHVVLTRHYGFGRWATTMLIGWLGGGLAVLLTVLQLPIVSRACDVTDIIFRMFGLGLGLLTWAMYNRRSECLSANQSARLRRTVARCVCAAVVVYIFYIGLIPFTFKAGMSGPVQSLRADGFLPFFAYFMARFDIMMGDVLEKFLSYAVLAATLTACWSRLRHRDAASILLHVTAAGLVISLTIEAAQMFIPVRVTSLTDPILAVAGCVVGVLGQQHAAMFYRFAVSELGDDSPGELTANRGATHSPSDALIATLFEPSKDAPVEAHPRPALQPATD